MRSLICAAVFAFVATPTWAQNKLDAQALKLYGGTYSSDCSSPAAVLLYSAAQGVVYGKIFQQRRATLIGAPPPAVAAELDRLWLAEWQQNR
jgi:hypothetical protein